MQWKLGAAIALVMTCSALAEELDQSAVADVLGELDSMMPRPSCDAERLNPTERSICADRDLSRFDALLELVYGRTTARDDDAAQLAWLRSERDAAGRTAFVLREPTPRASANWIVRPGRTTRATVPLAGC